MSLGLGKVAPASPKLRADAVKLLYISSMHSDEPMVYDEYALTFGESRATLGKSLRLTLQGSEDWLTEPTLQLLVALS